MFYVLPTYTYKQNQAHTSSEKWVSLCLFSLLCFPSQNSTYTFASSNNSQRMINIINILLPYLKKTIKIYFRKKINYFSLLMMVARHCPFLQFKINTLNISKSFKIPALVI